MPYHQELFDSLVLECSKQDFLQQFKDFVHAAGFTEISKPIELIDFLHTPSPEKYDETDKLLFALIKKVQSNQDSQWKHLLLASMLPGLEKIFVTLKYRTVLNEELWEEIVYCFLEVVDTWSPQKYDSHIDYNLYLQTKRQVVVRKEHYDKESRETISLDGLIMEPTQTTDASSLILYSLLERVTSEQVITQDEANLLLSNEVYGFSLKELASTQGVSYDNIRKQKSRIMNKLIAYVRNDTGKNDNS